MLHYILTWLRTRRSEEGQDLAEYALLMALVALGIVVALRALHAEMWDIMERIASEFLRHSPASS